MKHILVTGGAGFIGSNFIRNAIAVQPDWHIINLDSLTYAGNPTNFDDFSKKEKERHHFIRADITKADQINPVFEHYDIDGVFHFAAESHVDRSILGPKDFVETNVLGTFNLLECSLNYWQKQGKPDEFRFLHVSTDEVYGSLGPEGYFTEKTPYDPSSPYSASKAASDHLVKAYYRTYGLPALITNCSNNYGPFQFPEKLIPLMILNIIEEKPLPVYGDGKNIRDWLFVEDHCEGLLTAFKRGQIGETYNIGGNEERQNIDIVNLLCDLLDKKLGRLKERSSSKLIQFVKDRPGHDRRYAIDASKIKNELGWSPRYTFEEAIETTVDWYLAHMDWVDSIRTGDYRKWIARNYEQRS